MEIESGHALIKRLSRGIRALAALAFSGKMASTAEPDPQERSVPSGNSSGIPPIHEDIARQLLEAANGQDLKLVTTAFRTALRLDSDCLVNAGKTGLRSRDPVLVASAIEYMARFRPDDLFPELGRFLALPEPCIKRAAIGALRRTDPAQAISRLRVLLADHKRERPSPKGDGFGLSRRLKAACATTKTNKKTRPALRAS